MQIITGYADMYENIRRWSRTAIVRGALDDDTVADAVNTAVSQVHDLAIESNMPWCVKNSTVDDIGGDLGTEIEEGVYRLLIESDLGITDMARVRRLWRVPSPAASGRGVPIRHMDNIGPSAEAGAYSRAGFADERWVEDGDLNDDGLHEMSIVIYNRGNAIEGGLLRLNYWFTPEQVTADTFFEEDVNGDRTARPPLPKKVWPAITDYAKLVLLETTGDDYKRNALWARYHGPSGVLERLRTVFATFQTGDASYVDDAGMEIV